MKSLNVLKSGLCLFAIFTLASCATIREGEVGVKRTFGKYSDKSYTSGVKAFNPLASRIIRISTQTVNLEVGLDIPSKEGLTIRSEVSILYNIDGKKVPELLRNIGTDYERNIILPVFRSAVADVTSRFYAKDMHTGERATIEKAIKDQMMVLMDGKGIEVEAVLLKSIQLPRTLSVAIESKLEAEQQAQQMEFVLEQAKREADKKRIEAAGIRDAQLIIAEGLNTRILQFKSIEAFQELAKSPNAKVIITDGGGLPMIMESEMGIDLNTSQRKVSLEN
ncbi:MAG: regulator of protease activity HflC (stomatin/prohibitin superfamily) [Granulosicoccus sp.]|jgi:regulator of protease activity HflC (stomatin/prohibitin superfamily)